MIGTGTLVRPYSRRWLSVLACALEGGALAAAPAPRRDARMVLELQAELRAEQQPAGSADINQREIAHQVVARLEPRLEGVEQPPELRAVELRRRLAAVLRPVRHRRIQAVVQILHHVGAELGHRPYRPADRVGVLLALRRRPQALRRAVAVAEVEQHRARFEELELAVGERRHLAVRIDRKSTRLNSSHQLISYAVF